MEILLNKSEFHISYIKKPITGNSNPGTSKPNR